MTLTKITDEEILCYYSGNYDGIEDQDKEMIATNKQWVTAMVLPLANVNKEYFYEHLREILEPE